MDDNLIKEVFLALLEAATNIPGTNPRKLTELRLKVEHAGQEAKKVEVDAYGAVIEPGQDYGPPVDEATQTVRTAIDSFVKE